MGKTVAALAKEPIRQESVTKTFDPMGGVTKTLRPTRIWSAWPCGAILQHEVKSLHIVGDGKYIHQNFTPGADDETIVPYPLGHRYQQKLPQQNLQRLEL